MVNIERRAYKVAVKVREKEDGPKIVGYGAVFNQLSDELYGFRERIAPGAFANALKKSDVRALFNHNPDYVLGRTTNGTLKLEEDEKGLRYEIIPPDTQWARDLIKSIQRGDINQSSFAFTVKRDKWEETEDGITIRTILEFDEIFDVSPVTYPAYPQTAVGVREAYQRYLDSNLWRLRLLRKKLILLEKMGV